MGQASGRVPLAPCPCDDASGWRARHQNHGAFREAPTSPEGSSNDAEILRTFGAPGQGAALGRLA
jgi:hypothetical protein